VESKKISQEISSKKAFIQPTLMAKKNPHKMRVFNLVIEFLYQNL